MIPPATKKPRLVRMYRIPIRLWSTVVSQLEKRPRERIAAAGSGADATSTATAAPRKTLHVSKQGIHLPAGPAPADGGHLDASVSQQRLERWGLGEHRVSSEVGSEPTLSLEAVTGRADAIEGHLAEVGGAVRLRARLPVVPGLEVATRERLDGGVHVRVVVAAELAALALEGALPVGLEGQVVGLARN